MDKKELLMRIVGISFQEPHVKKIVEIENGKIIGHREPMHMVVEWFGIPYAATAKGKLRWRKPQPAPAIQGILNCIKPSTEQNVQNFGSRTFGTEGLLTLNVCRPDTDDVDLPVIIYFHGGNFQVGNAQEWLGNKFCMERKAIHVSAEYRLGALGFNNLPALRTGDPEEDSGNYTLLDCKAALEWVQRNISKFGGDPNNVTISGHSGGGRACLLMLTSPLFKGLFHKAIVFNSPALTCTPENARLVFAHRFAWLAVQDGLFSSEQDAVDWLMSEDEKDMKQAKNWLYNLSSFKIINLFPLAGARMHMFPSSFTDGYVVAKDGYKTEYFNSVPLLVMRSADEFKSFVPVDSFFKQRLKNNPDDEELKAEMNFAKKVGSRLYHYQNSMLIARLLANHYKEQIYIGSLDYGSHEGGVDKKFMERYGAVHGNVLPFITDQYRIPWKRGNDFFQHQGAIRLSEVISGCIYNFMCSGSPNCPELPLNWHPWQENNAQSVIFDADRQNLLIRDSYENFSYEEEFAAIDADTTISQEAKLAIIRKVLAYRWFSEELDKHYANPNPWYTR